MANSNPWYQRFPSNELSETLLLNYDEYGLLQRFRDFAWENEGFADEEIVIKRLAKRFGCSNYKLKKIWPILEKFFTLREGFFFYEKDEAKRLRVVDISSKRKQAGMLGASARWSTQGEDQAAGTENGDSKPMANAISDAMASEEVLPPDTTTTARTTSSTKGELLLPPNPHEDGSSSSPPPVLNQPDTAAAALTDGEFNAICEHSRSLGMQAPTRSLAEKIRQKLKHLPTIEQVIATLPKFSGQTSPGLWASGDITVQALIDEATRGQRKPASATDEQRAQHSRVTQAIERSRSKAR